MSLDWEIEELAGYAMGKTEDEVETMVNNSTVDDELLEKYGVDFEAYSQIIKDVFPHVPVVKTAITGDRYHAFLTKDFTRMIARMKYQGKTDKNQENKHEKI